MSKIDLAKYKKKLSNVTTIVAQGYVTDISGLVIGATGPLAPVGEICRIKCS